MLFKKFRDVIEIYLIDNEILYTTLFSKAPQVNEE